jgi:hypothetical protein
VELTGAELQLVSRYGDLAADEGRSIASAAARDALWVYLPEAISLARHLAVAANRIPFGPLQREVEKKCRQGSSNFSNARGV